jgi:hypothetical protein
MTVDTWPVLTISTTSSAPRLEAQISMDKVHIFGFDHDATQVPAQFLWPFSMILTAHSMQALMSTCENSVVLSLKVACLQITTVAAASTALKV